jgi:hypothetical protein
MLLLGSKGRLGVEGKQAAGLGGQGAKARQPGQPDLKWVASSSGSGARA